MGFIQESGSAAGTSFTSGQKVALSATANVGSLLLLHAQVGAQYVPERVYDCLQFVLKLSLTIL